MAPSPQPFGHTRLIRFRWLEVCSGCVYGLPTRKVQQEASTRLLRFYNSLLHFKPYRSRGFGVCGEGLNPNLTPEPRGPELGLGVCGLRNENLKLGPGVLPEARARW